MRDLGLLALTYVVKQTSEGASDELVQVADAAGQVAVGAGAAAAADGAGG